MGATPVPLRRLKHLLAPAPERVTSAHPRRLGFIHRAHQRWHDVAAFGIEVVTGP